MNSSIIPTGLNFAGQKQLEELQYINLQLAALGQPTCEVEGDQQYLKIADSLLKNYSQQRRLLATAAPHVTQLLTSDTVHLELLGNGLHGKDVPAGPTAGDDDGARHQYLRRVPLRRRDEAM